MEIWFWRSSRVQCEDGVLKEFFWPLWRCFLRNFLVHCRDVVLKEFSFHCGVLFWRSSLDCSGDVVLNESSCQLWSCCFEGVLEEDDDTLINVNIIDEEKAAKNIENKKKKPDYKPYDESDMDEYGMVCLPTIILTYYCSSGTLVEFREFVN